MKDEKTNGGWDDRNGKKMISEKNQDWFWPIQKHVLERGVCVRVSVCLCGWVILV